MKLFGFTITAHSVLCKCRLCRPTQPGYDAGRKAGLVEGAQELLKGRHKLGDWAGPTHQALCTPCQYIRAHSELLLSMTESEP